MAHVRQGMRRLDLRRIARATASVRCIATGALGAEKVTVGGALILEAVVLRDVVDLGATWVAGVLGAALAGLRGNGRCSRDIESDSKEDG